MPTDQPERFAHGHDQFARAGGRLNAARHANEQLIVEHAAQSGECVGDRRLGHAEAFGRAACVFSGVEGFENNEKVKVDFSEALVIFLLQIKR